MFLAGCASSILSPGVNGLWMAAVFFALMPAVKGQNQYGGAFSFTTNRFVATETEGLAFLTVTRDSDFGKMQVDVLISNGTATNGVDFKTTPASSNITLTFNHLQTAVTIPVEIVNNSISNAGGMTLGNFALTNARPAVDESTFVTGMVARAKNTSQLAIFDDDVERQFNFDKLLYTVSEPNTTNGTTVELKVKLAKEPGDGAQGVEVDYEILTDRIATRAGSDYATPGADYEPVALGTLQFGNNDTEQSIFVTITNDSLLEFNEDLHVILREARGTVSIETPADPAVPDSMPTTTEFTFALGRATVATVTILFNPADTQPKAAGSVDFAWNSDNEPNTVPPFNRSPGANNTVYALAVDARTNTVIVGDFTAVNAVSRNRIARLLPDGQLDTSFDPLSGANDFVTAVAAYTNGTRSGQILVGGGFTSVNGVQRNGIARLISDGSTDLGFSPGTGANGPIYAVSLQKDGTILVGGDFTTFNGVPRNRIARLLADGGLDVNFNPGTGANGPVFSIYSLSAEPIVVNEGMTNGAVGTVARTVAVGAQSGFLVLTYNFYNATNDIRVLAGNTQIHYTNRMHEVIGTNSVGEPVTNSLSSVVALPFSAANSNLTFIVNTGGTNESTNWFFRAEIQPDRSLGVLVGGDFTTFNGVEHGNVAKLQNNGTVDSSFSGATGIGADGTVYTLGVQNGKPVLGGSFRSFNSFPSAGLARLNENGSFDRDFAIGTGAEDGIVNALMVQGDGRILVGGSFTSFNQTRRVFLTRLLTNGPIDTAFLDPSYNQYAGFPNPTGLGPVGFLTSLALDQNGGVIVGGVFTHVGGGLNRTAIRARNNVARLHGGDTLNRPGNLEFVQPLFGGDENSGSLGITLARVGGALGPATVSVVTSDAAAISTNDYKGVVTNAVWGVAGPRQADGVTGNSVVRITLNDDTLIEGDEQFFVTALDPNSTFNLGGEFIPAGVALGKLQKATGVILENDVPPSVIEFSKAEYDANENDVRVTITVTRSGGTGSAVSARYTTSALDATAGVDYLDASQVINFRSGQTSETFTITLRDDANAEQDERVNLALSNLSPGAVLGSNKTAVINIIDNDYAPGRVNFSAATYSVGEGAGQIVVNVRRTGGNSGVLRLSYSTEDASATAPFDYLQASGSLQWNDQDSATRTIVIPISEDGAVEGSENFVLRMITAEPPGALGTRTNATITILDNDSLGAFSFNAAEYLADENGTNVVVNVVRRGGSAQAASVDYVSTNVTAQAGRDYEAVSGTLTFGVGESSKSFVVPIIDNASANSERRLRLLLRNPQPAGAILGLLTNVTIVIVDNESLNIPAGSVETDFATGNGANDAVHALGVTADGKILIGGDFTVVHRQVRTRLARLLPDGSLDTAFGTDFDISGSVRDIEVLADGRLIIAGAFTTIDGEPARYLARMSAAGAVDKTFNTGAGADNPVLAVAETFVGAESKILIGGSFSTFNGEQRRGIARVNADGRADTSFNPGSGVNGTVYAVKVQRDGKILIGGDFTSVGGVPRINVARLNPDGSLDTTFDVGLGADGSVRAIAVQFDDKVLIGGLFTGVSGVTRGHLARLNADGSLDVTFDSQTGANGAVYAIALQLDGKILVGGDFTSMNGVPENRIARLNPDGSIDPSINFGRGANAFIGAMLIQSDRRILVGGGFTEFDGLPRGRFARVYGGSIRGNGEFEFSSAEFTSNENATNLVITVRRSGGLLGAATIDYSSRSGTASGGVDYTDVSGTLSFGSGENTRTFTIPLLNDNLAEDPETIDLILSNPTGGAVLGQQPVASVRLISDDSVISFSELIYSVNELSQGGRAIVQIIREGDTSSPVTVVFNASAGTATSADFVPVTSLVTIPAGQSSAVVTVTINDDTAVEENETVLLRLSSPGAGGILGRPSATLTILDNDFAPGNLSVIEPVPVTENAGTTGITVTRTSGKTGAISVRYALRNGTAIAGQDFVNQTGTLSFLEGETTKTFLVQILDDAAIEGNESFQIELFQPTGGANVPAADRFTSVLILDDDFGPGSLDTTFNIGSGASGAVRDIDLQADGKVLLGGEFDFFGDYFAGGVARLSENGAIESDFAFNGGTDGVVFSVAQSANGKIALGGNFTSVAGFFRQFVGRVLTNGFPDSTFVSPAGENGRVLAVEALPNGKLVVGGEFTTPTRYIVRLNTDGSLDVSFNPDGGTDAPVRDIAIQSDERVLIGGAFTRVGAANVRGLARLLPTGLLDSSFRIGAGVNGAVNAIEIAPDGKILIGGDFTTVNGVSRTRIARLNHDGTLDASFNLPIGPNAAVHALAFSRGKIYVAGEFTTIGGTNRTRVARLTFDGALDPSFDPGIGPDAAVYALAAQNSGQILIGGAFSTVNGFSTPGIARLNGDKTVASEVRISEVRSLNGAIQFTFNSEVGSTYVIEGSDNLIAWQTVDARVASGPSTNFSIPAGGARKFFRIRVNP